jgi:Nif-specific regulatory protein
MAKKKAVKVDSPPVDSPPEEKLLAILKICQKMNSKRDPALLLDLLAREAARLVEADRSTIFLLDKDKRELWSWVALDSEEIRFDARLGIAGAVAMSGEVINVKDAQQDPRFYLDVDQDSGYQTKSVLAVPLKNYDGEIIGTFEALNKKKGSFNSEDEDILQALASNAAIAIETAQLFENLKTHRDKLLEENTQLWREVEGKFATQHILGTSEKIQKIVRLLEQVSDSEVSVLIEGESGTGKELVARAIHHGSSRARRPLVTVNCAALPETLLESELFGIEKGVATGVERRVGKFEVADGGTLFLDEIGDLSLVAQAKILRTLQEKVVERVGASGGCESPGRHQQGFGRRDQEGQLSRRPLLSPEGDSREDAFASRYPHRHSPFGQSFPVPLLQGNGKGRKGIFSWCHGVPGQLPMAGKCSGIGKRDEEAGGFHS